MSPGRPRSPAAPQGRGRRRGRQRLADLPAGRAGLGKRHQPAGHHRQAASAAGVAPAPARTAPRRRGAAPRARRHPEPSRRPSSRWPWWSATSPGPGRWSGRAAAGIATAVFRPPTSPPGAEHDGPSSPRSPRRRPDLVVLAGYMRLVAPEFVQAFPWRIINLHPALLPAFPGTTSIDDALRVRGQGHRSDRALRGRGAGYRGRSSPRSRCGCKTGDTPESLAARIHAVEHELLPADHPA